ncbi:hypothetical protein D3C77_609040 [compost metagenome]
MVKQGQHRIGDVARARPVDVAVAHAGLLMHVEALRHDQLQAFLGARHGHVQQAALFLDFFGGAGAHVGRDAAIDHIQHIDRLPFLALGRVDGGQDHVVLVARGRTGLVAGGVGRVQCELGQEAFARRVARRQPHQLIQVGLAHAGVVI